MKISLTASGIARILATVLVLLVLASVGGQFSKFVFGHDNLKGFVPLFFVDAELNIPAFFSMLLMLFISLLLAVIATLNSKQRLPHTSK